MQNTSKSGVNQAILIHSEHDGGAPPAFRDWLAAQLKNPPDERLRPALQAAWDEMEAAGWRMPDTWEGEAS